MSSEEPDTIPDSPPPAQKDLPPDFSKMGPAGSYYPIPSATPENMVCLRGPCRYYWFLKSDARLGNVVGTFEEMGVPIPRKHHHVCTLNPAQETVFEDDCAYECSRWDPLTQAELDAIEARRDEYRSRTK